MTVEALEVLKRDDTYIPSDGPHIAWEPCQFIDDIDGYTQRQSRGARLYLRDGRRTLAVAEVEGTRSTVIDVADEVSSQIGPWLATMRHLADAVALEGEADTLDLNIGHLVYHWEASQDMFVTAANHRLYDEEVSMAYRYEDLVRAVVPREDQRAHPLPEAAAMHSARLRQQAEGLRAQALLTAPDLREGPLPGVSWVGPYSRAKHKELRAFSESTWYADLPHQLLKGWKAADTAVWSAEERTGRRNALIRWAAARGLPKKVMADASGIARTTIDRVLTDKGTPA
ncbi:hypothetical protein [Streptomyces albus]|uniref:Uncharacterized protein n=1 Tax=Streptomyces albus TaxID=1888 RepID=A0A8H1L6F4_9ACTN|nr:hypothetical protein [Streptomyces albus]TGG78493.1 hypothetical protein D8771_25210 [Streptomyces albus]UVN59425.1 hypothetical protein NR995_33340 [Streptomyces albus]